MRSRVLISAFALALTGAITSCDEDITSVGEGLNETATWIADMDASQETTAPNLAGASNPSGRAWFIDHGNDLTYFIEWSGLSTPVLGPGSGAHIHRAAVGQPGPVIVPLAVMQRTSATVAGVIDMTVTDVAPSAAETVSPDSLRTLLNNGNAYVNIHTTQNGGGEIRGQVRRN
jgi:hypothetical protein